MALRTLRSYQAACRRIAANDRHDDAAVDGRCIDTGRIGRIRSGLIALRIAACQRLDRERSHRHYFEEPAQRARDGQILDDDTLPIWGSSVDQARDRRSDLAFGKALLFFGNGLVSAAVL